MEKNNQLVRFVSLAFAICLFPIIVYRMINDLQVSIFYMIFWFCLTIDYFYEYKISKSKYKLIMVLLGLANVMLLMVGHYLGKTF